jgi:hypothetical protein
MDKYELIGWNLGRVYHSRSGFTAAMHLSPFEAKQSNLNLKTRPKQLLGSLPLDIVLPGTIEKFGILDATSLGYLTQIDFDHGKT